jgi:hypothetical protein
MSNGIKSLAIGKCHSFHEEENISRAPGAMFGTDPKKREADMAALAQDLSIGYDVLQGGVFAVYELTPEQQEAAASERATQWQIMRDRRDEFTFRAPLTGSKLTLAASDVLRTFEELYTDKGKVIVPTHGINAGHRRSVVWHIAQAIRRRCELGDIEHKIPVKIEKYDSNLDRFCACIRENTGKTSGMRALSNADFANAAKMLFQEQCSESDMMRRAAIKRGKAQQLFALMLLDSRFPELELADSVITGERTLATFEKEETRKLAKAQETTAEDVTKFVTSGAGKPKKVASRSDIKTLAEQCPVELIKVAAYFIFVDDTKGVNPLVDAAPEINKAVRSVLKTAGIKMPKVQPLS